MTYNQFTIPYNLKQDNKKNSTKQDNYQKKFGPEIGDWFVIINYFCDQVCSKKIL
jgi:hypothetical protein